MNLILAILWYSFDMTVQEDTPHAATFADEKMQFPQKATNFAAGTLC